MKRAKRLILSILMIGACSFLSCAHHDEALPNSSSAAARTAQTLLGQDTNQVSGAHSVPDERRGNTGAYRRTKEAAMIDWEKVDKDNEERLRNPHPSDWPLPNFETGPGRPLPSYVNFYCMNDRYPVYLLCEYDVKEQNYNQTNEPEWFKAALEQIRRSGPKKFPPIRWVAVAIRNVAEHRDVSTFEQSFKVGALFKASGVFDPSRDLSQLVAHAEMDRHPFLLDQQQPTPGEQQRWVIVERYAATNHTPSTFKN